MASPSHERFALLFCVGVTSAACLALASSVYLIAKGSGSSSALPPASDLDAHLTSGRSKTRRRAKVGETKSDSSPVDPNRPWKRVVQYWSESLRTWETRSNDLDPASAAAGELFVVKERKSKDPDGQDELFLEVVSPTLVVILRQIMKDSESVCEDQPTVDARDVFVRRSLLQDLLRFLDTVCASSLKGFRPPRHSQAAVQDRDPYAALFAPLEVVPESASPALDIPQHTRDRILSMLKEAQKSAVPEATSKNVTDAVVAKTAKEHLAFLLTWLEDEFRAVDQKLSRLLPSRISWPLLWAVFREGTYATVLQETSGEQQGIIVKQAYYAVSLCDGPYFGIRGQFLQYDGSGFAKMTFSCRIHEFKGVRELSSLEATPLNDEDHRKLQARGKQAKALAGVHHVQYSGSLYQIEGWGMQRHVVRRKADGRTMVDSRSFMRMNPGNEVTLDLNYWTGRNSTRTVSDEDVWLLPPTVLGYSLVLKEWGEFLVGAGFGEIEFSDQAFDHLVLEPSTKELVRALVDHAEGKNGGSGSVTDVISGKGGGLICVLHGRPGTGKTLTAEAVSERLKKPLFTVSSSSLGLNPSEVEQNLRDALELAHIWSAVILIDEADVFLEARGEHETGRNALVSVFLRLLEYHESVMFLTTNRVRSFDEAFISRFNVMIRYPNLDSSKRAMIWRKFLEKAKVPMDALSPPAKIQKSIDDVETSSNATSHTAVSATAEPGRDDDEAEKKDHDHEVEKKDDDSKVTEDRDIMNEALIAELSRRPLNGRAIKNHVRTAQALARAANEELGAKHLLKVLKTAEQFKKDIKELDMLAGYEEDEEGFPERFRMFL